VAPIARWSAIIASKRSDAWSTTDRSVKASLNMTMPGPSMRARTSFACTALRPSVVVIRPRNRPQS
jgi:hypothetical protein